MTRKKALLLLNAALCVLLAVMLAAAAVGIYKTGMAEKRDNPLAQVYTREKVGQALKPIAPVFLLNAALSCVCAALGVRDESVDKPVRHADAASARRREERAAGVKAPVRTPARPENLTAVRLIILAVAAAFLILGVRNGSMSAVVNKAIRICTECVGLG